MRTRIGHQAYPVHLKQDAEGGWAVTIGPLTMTAGASRLLGLRIEDATSDERDEPRRLGFLTASAHSAPSHAVSAPLAARSVAAPTHTALVSVDRRLLPQLVHSFLWRHDIRRMFAAPGELLEVARTLGPDLIVIAADLVADATTLVGELRRQPSTRRSVVIVLCDDVDAGERLADDGPHLLLPSTLENESPEWRAKLAQLLQLRQRAGHRTVVDLDVDVRFVADRNRAPLRARALNLSHGGILLAMTEGLAVGTRIELRLVGSAGRGDAFVSGEVVHATCKAEIGWLTGVHFCSLGKQVRLAIREVLEQFRSLSDETPVVQTMQGVRS